jgi:uncharacterized damage-inducible protein DinB
MHTTARTIAMNMLRYGHWALERHASALREHGLTEHERVLWIVNHVVNAKRIWLERVRDGVISTRIDDPLPLDEALARSADDTAGWVAWLDSLPGDDLDRAMIYRNLKGDEYRQPLHEIVFHVINHGTHHLHEIGTILRTHGAVPPPTDYIVYTRA